MKEIFRTHVRALLQATRRPRIKEAEAWFTIFRKLGHPAYVLCMDMVDNSDGTSTIPDRIIAAQNIAWFCKRGDFDIEFAPITALICSLDRCGDPMISPVLSQIYLAIAAFVCRYSLSAIISGTGDAVHVCDVLRTALDQCALLRVLSSMPELILSKELKLKIPPSCDRAMVSMHMCLREAPGVVGLVDSLLDAALATVEGGYMQELLHCVGQWLGVIPDICAAVKDSNGYHALAGAIMSHWARSSLVAFAATRLMSQDDSTELYLKSSELMVSLLNAVSCTGPDHITGCYDVLSTVLKLLSQRTDRAVSRFSSVISAVLPSLMTAKVIADDRGLVATVNSAAETLSLCLESAFEVLGACLSVCVAVPNEKYDSAVKQLVVITIESCGPRAVGALVAALQAMAGLYVRVPVSDINHAATLGAIPPQLEVYWRVMVALKRWLVYTGDRLITLLHNMLEPYIDFGPLGIEVVSNCVKLLLMISPLLPEPFLVVSERKEHGFDTMALSWREVFGSVAAALLRAWSEQDRDDLKEHRTALRNLVRSVSSFFSEDQRRGMVMWAAAGAVAALKAANSPLSVGTDGDLGWATLRLSMWTQAEAHLHLCSCLASEFRDAISDGAGGKECAVALLLAIFEAGQSKGVMRMGVMIIAEIAAEIINLMNIDKEEELIKQCLTTLLDTVSVFPERSEGSLQECACVCGSSSPFDATAILLFEQKQQRRLLSFRTKQDHIGCVSLLKLIQKISAEHIRRGHLCADTVTSGLCMDSGLIGGVIMESMYKTFVNLLISSLWNESLLTALTWKSLLLLLESICHVATSLEINIFTVDRACVGSIPFIGSHGKGLCAVEQTLGTVLAMYATTSHRVIDALRLPIEHGDIRSELVLVLDKALASRMNFDPDIDRDTFYRPLLVIGDEYCRQLVGLSISATMDHLLRAVLAVSETTAYISSALTTLCRHGAVSIKTSGLIRDSICRITSSFWLCSRLLLPRTLQIVLCVAARKDFSIDSASLYGLYSTACRALDVCCSVLTPQSMGLCAPISAGPMAEMMPVAGAQLLCRCCTMPVQLTSGIDCVHEALAVNIALMNSILQFTGECMRETIDIEIWGLATNCLIRSLRTLQLGPLRIIKCFSQFIDVKSYFQLVLAAVLKTGSDCENIYFLHPLATASVKDALRTVVCTVLMELLRTAGYTFSRIDTFWCRRRRAVVEKQKIISVGSDKNNVIVPAGYDWWAVCGDFDTPLPPLESSLSPNVISEDQLESILLLSSKVILDCLSQIDVNVEGRESLSAAFLLHCGLLCSVSVPVWVVRGDGAVAVSGLEYIPTVDEDGAVVSTLDKIMTAAPDCGVLMSCGSTDIGAASDVFSKGKIKQSRGAIPMLMHSIEPKGDQSVIRMFLDKGWLVGHILRIIITCLGCGRDKHGILSSREKDSFCRLCLKVCVVFGAQLVSSATEQCALLLSSEPHKQNAISVWKSAVATVDTKKFVNILKNNFK